MRPSVTTGWSALAAALTALLTFTTGARGAWACEPRAVLDLAEVVVLDGGGRDLPGTLPQRTFAGFVTFPDSLGPRSDGRYDIAWYHFRVPPAARALSRCGLLIRSSVNVAVYVNGEWLGHGAPFPRENARVWNRPLYFAFPAESLHEESNSIDIAVQTMGTNFARLERVELGPDAVLRPTYERQLFLHVRLAEASTVISAALSVLFLTLSLMLRDPINRWFSLATLAYTVMSLDCHWREPPVDYWQCEAIKIVATACTCSFLTRVGLRLLDFYRFWSEAALWALIVFEALLANVLDGPQLARAFPTLLALSVTPPVVTVVFLALDRHRIPTLERRIISATGLSMAAIGVNDVVLSFRLQSGTGSGEGFMVPYFGLVMVSGFAAALLIRFLRVYRRAERANAELALEAAAKQRELELNFTRVRDLERAQMIALERERIVREMHDGIGGHLVAMLAMSERGNLKGAQLVESARDALDDLDLVIHSLDTWADSIPALLAGMRTRLEARLAGEGLRFECSVGDLPHLPKLGPAEILHVLRILQEAVANAIKHAGPHSLALLAHASDTSRSVVIEVSDDGSGLREGQLEGRGLGHMRRRAQALGGALQVDSRRVGTTVRLSIPVARWS